MAQVELEVAARVHGPAKLSGVCVSDCGDNQRGPQAPRAQQPGSATRIYLLPRDAAPPYSPASNQPRAARGPLGLSACTTGSLQRHGSTQIKAFREDWSRNVAYWASGSLGSFVFVESPFLRPLARSLRDDTTAANLRQIGGVSVPASAARLSASRSPLTCAFSLSTRREAFSPWRSAIRRAAPGRIRRPSAILCVAAGSHGDAIAPAR